MSSSQPPPAQTASTTARCVEFATSPARPITASSCDPRQFKSYAAEMQKLSGSGCVRVALELITQAKPPLSLQLRKERSMSRATLDLDAPTLVLNTAHPDLHAAAKDYDNMGFLKILVEEDGVSVQGTNSVSPHPRTHAASLRELASRSGRKHCAARGSCSRWKPKVFDGAQVPDGSRIACTHPRSQHCESASGALPVAKQNNCGDSVHSTGRRRSCLRRRTSGGMWSSSWSRWALMWSARCPPQ